jgi:hypothetical protein
MESDGSRCPRPRKVVWYLFVNPGKRAANEAQLQTKYQGASGSELEHSAPSAFGTAQVVLRRRHP